jgi:hypothetical protein
VSGQMVEHGSDLRLSALAMTLVCERALPPDMCALLLVAQVRAVRCSASRAVHPIDPVAVPCPGEAYFEWSSDGRFSDLWPGPFACKAYRGWFDVDGGRHVGQRLRATV